MPERHLENWPPLFENKHCKFKPFDWTEIDNVLLPLVYKVVKVRGNEFVSLGLRRNPNILIFPVRKWIKLMDDEIRPGISDDGGIWSCLRRGGATGRVKYMAERYQAETRIFIAAIENPLFANNDRIKSQGVMLLKEVKL